MSCPIAPKPDTFTPAAVTADVLAIADAAGADRFAWWGYSFGGVAGLQLALRTDRVTALAMTGFPPLDGSYAEMLRYRELLAAVETGGADRIVVLPRLSGFLDRHRPGR